MTIDVAKSLSEKRLYPRIQASCPVLFQVSSDGDAWQDAVLHDYSATGARFTCEDFVLTGEKLKIRLMPGNVQKIPSISAESVVVRCGLDDDHTFQIGCKFLKVDRYAS